MHKPNLRGKKTRSPRSVAVCALFRRHVKYILCDKTLEMLESFWGLLATKSFTRPVRKFLVPFKRSHIIIVSSNERIVPVVLS